MQQFNDLRRPVVQHAAEFRRSRGRTNTEDRQVATALVTVDPKDDLTVGLMVDVDLMRRALSAPPTIQGVPLAKC